MTSLQFQKFMRNVECTPCENPQRIGHAALRKLQNARVADDVRPCADVDVRAGEIDGVPVEWLTPEGAPDAPVMLYIHGGGWSLGSLKTTRMFLAPMAKRLGIRTLSVGYRLMPENPFPAGLDDCFAVYLGLLEQDILPGQIFLAGESAGANIALALALRLRDRGYALPAKIAVMSPVTFVDTLEGSHTRLIPLEKILPEDSFVVTVAAAQYAPGWDLKTPYISPLYADLTGLPPTFVSVGTDEILFDDAIRFYQKARLCGVDAELLVGDRMPHSWPIFLNDFPEAGEAIDRIGAFFRQTSRNV